jgi:hypothetical protein
MADAPIVHIGENSPEQVAFKLLQTVAFVEKKRLTSQNAGGDPDRKWILDTYAECIRAVREPHLRGLRAGA